MTFWRFLHLTSLFLMMGGVGATVVPIWKAWVAPTIEEKSFLLNEAQRGETLVLLPGLIATFFSGYFWATAADWNVITTGWLVALQVLTMLDIFIFVPLMGIGLRRVRYLALAARKHGSETPELHDALEDKVPLVFGTLIVATIPLMVWLPVFKPF
ncbi:MAG: DUF2269 family protein [Chloroflexi bacterium]|nr:DUF2269 family protein [Chloroflexota bacterium]